MGVEVGVKAETNVAYKSYIIRISIPFCARKIWLLLVKSLNSSLYRPIAAKAEYKGGERSGSLLARKVQSDKLRTLDEPRVQTNILNSRCPV